MQDVTFEAQELRSDGGFDPVTLRFEGDEVRGWRIERNGSMWLEPGPGYRLLRTAACGVCATDLERVHLPFALPQVVGHEILAVDADGQRFVAEINASPYARGAPRRDCEDCLPERHRHCRERLVLGIHDLPGGFGGWVLAPVNSLVPVPDALPSLTAVLAEPFAAALRAVERTPPRDGDQIAVLGPRRLGSLLVAALQGQVRRLGLSCVITSLVRRPELVDLQRRVGADRVELVGPSGREGLSAASFDVVFDTTGSPEGLETALWLARREVHLKSTHGRPSAGLVNPTAFVVDELGLERFDPRALRPRGQVAWMSGTTPPADWSLGIGVTPVASPAVARRIFMPGPAAGCLVGAPTVVVDRFDQVDAVIRPEAGAETGAVRPAGRILVVGEGEAPGPLEEAVMQRGVRLSSSRCGDFRRAVEMLADDAELRGLGEIMFDHRASPDALAAAFSSARSPGVTKVLVEHPLDG